MADGISHIKDDYRRELTMKRIRDMIFEARFPQATQTGVASSESVKGDSASLLQSLHQSDDIPSYSWYNPEYQNLD